MNLLSGRLEKIRRLKEELSRTKIDLLKRRNNESLLRKLERIENQIRMEEMALNEKI